jgi:copper(I)-binding protein
MKFSTRHCVALLAAWSLAAMAADGPTVSDAWARATAPGVDVGAVYLAIEGGATADRLVSGSTARAAMVHLHTVVEDGGVAKMRPVDGIDVPAGGHVELVPKGMHLMLIGLETPLVAGETFTVTLRFATAGERVVTVTVRSAGDEPRAHH